MKNESHNALISLKRPELREVAGMGKEYVIGVNLGATNVRVAIGDSKGQILEKLK